MGASNSILRLPKGKIKRVPCYINGRLNTQDMGWKTTPKYEPYIKELVDTLEIRVLLATQIWTFRNRSLPNELREKITTSDCAKATRLGPEYSDTKLVRYKRKSTEVQDKQEEIEKVMEADSIEKLIRETDRIHKWFSDIKQCRQNRKKRPLTSLEETYLQSTQKVPRWFTDTFGKGHRTFKLTPKFPRECPGASVEYDELVNATFFITINMLEEKPLMSRCLVQATVFEHLSIPESSYRPDADPIQAHFWRQRYVYMVESIDDLFMRRVHLVGMIDRSNEVTGVITSPGDVCGTYRRQMTTRKEFLTWKIELPNV
ncbi:hypothetical protein CHS0354_007787 [Potamilus streckersoni]|uniref:Uncharacterized protein n=1 Tax=Potamilus streckersoni TaxID=2493646 RepID=A0AAE0TEU7_9BIVA|nr:hypothetical protein CHS0354_007787 [Potamilus streckersoni]